CDGYRGRSCPRVCRSATCRRVWDAARLRWRGLASRRRALRPRATMSPPENYAVYVRNPCSALRRSWTSPPSNYGCGPKVGYVIGRLLDTGLLLGNAPGASHDRQRSMKAPCEKSLPTFNLNVNTCAIDERLAEPPPARRSGRGTASPTADRGMG